jgi:hypothetical protein
MVLQVGDKVIVWNAGTDKAFAKKIERPEVGDKVDIITLSDGTKLSLPRINLDLSDYVWAFPQWDPGFNISDIPSSWGIIPLGACIFKLTGVPNCYTLADALREWDDRQLAGMLLIMLSGNNQRVRYTISSNDAYQYIVYINPPIPPGYDGWIQTIHYGDAQFLDDELIIHATNGGNDAFVELVSPVYEIMGYESYTFSYKIRIVKTGTMPQANIEFQGVEIIWLTQFLVLASTIYNSAECASLGIGINDYINPLYPAYDTYTGVFPIYFNSTIKISAYASTTGSPKSVYFWYGDLVFIGSDCETAGCAVGDKYIIYDPVTKRLVFNDATKTLLSSQYWQDVSLVGETIALTPIEYAWDGTGYVYLSGSKSIFSTIMFDDELRIDAQAGDTVQTIAYHQGERVAYGGETVSRELTDITSILRAGNNFITATVRHVDGVKVGFVTGIFVKRNATPISL